MSYTGKGRVYFLKPVGMAGPIKIGCSCVPEERLSVLAAWSPIDLELIGSVVGTFQDERWLHRCFADAHHRREWFLATPKLVAAIDAILSAGTVDAVRAELKPVGTKYPCFPGKPKKQREEIPESVKQEILLRVEKNRGETIQSLINEYMDKSNLPKPSLDYSSEWDAEITKRGLDGLAKAYTKAFSNLPKPPKTGGEVR
jgi:hypothetical protein